MVFANALYIDEHNKLYLAGHGTHRTGLYHGEMQPLARIPPTGRMSMPCPNPRFSSDAGCWKSALPGRVLPLHLRLRVVLALCAESPESRSSSERWPSTASMRIQDQRLGQVLLVELLSIQPAAMATSLVTRIPPHFSEFLTSYMRRKFPNRPHDIWFWARLLVESPS
jgi:hypothetical protein